MTTAPATPREFEEYVMSLSDPTVLAKDVKAGTFQANLTGYLTASLEAKNATMADLQAQVKEEAQIALAELLKDTGAARKLNLNPIDTSGPAKYSALQNDRAVGAPLNGLFKDIGDYAHTVWNRDKIKDPEVLNKLVQVMDYQERIPSEGGFLVPEEFRAELLRLSLENSVVRPRARVVPMGTATLKFPAVDETSRVSSVFGGIIVYRTEESAELTESSAAFASIKLDATKQTALAHVTNELIRDTAGAFSMYIEQMFPEAIAHFEDIDYLTGSGVGEPKGALSAVNTAMITVAKEAGQAAATVVWENVLRMYARMLPSSIGRAVWVVTPDAFVELATMALVVGTGGSAVWITDGVGAPTLTLLGRPVVMTEKAPAVLGTQGDISFVDFGYYLIGDRQLMTIDASEHVKFTSDRTTYRVIQRNDGRPWLQSAITPQNNGPSLSPFVQLATRS